MLSCSLGFHPRQCTFSLVTAQARPLWQCQSEAFHGMGSICRVSSDSDLPKAAVGTVRSFCCQRTRELFGARLYRVKARLEANEFPMGSLYFLSNGMFSYHLLAVKVVFPHWGHVHSWKASFKGVSFQSTLHTPRSPLTR